MRTRELNTAFDYLEGHTLARPILRFRGKRIFDIKRFKRICFTAPEICIEAPPASQATLLPE